MFKTLVRDIFLYSFNTFLAKGIAFFLIPIFTSILLPSEYGIIDTFVVIGGLIKVFVGFEITQAISRYYLETKDEHKPIFVSTSFAFYLFSYLVFLLSIVLFDDQFNLFLTEDSKLITVYYLAIGSIIVNSIFQFWQNQLRWGLKSAVYTKNSIAYTCITYGLSIYFIVYLDLRLEGYFLATLLSSTVLSIYIIYCERELLVLGFDTTLLKKLLHFSFPLVFSSVAVIATNYMDRIAIKNLLTLNELGVYGVGFRIASLITLVFIGVRIAIGPLVYKHYNEKGTPQKIADLTSVFVVLTVIIITSISIFSRECISLIAGEAYIEAWKVLPIIMISTFLGSGYIFTPGMNIAKKTKRILFISLIGLFLNLVFNYTLIPYFGIIGAALATLICAIIVQILYIINSQKLYFIPFDSKLITLCVFIGGLVIYIFGYYFQVLNFDLEYTLIRIFVISAIILVLFLFRKALWLQFWSRLRKNFLSKSQN